MRRAGGVPLLLPPGEPRQDELFALLDGIVFTGGPDVEPARYGGSAHREVYGVDPERDTTEIELVRSVVRTGRPTLGICRGAQVINVALGGTLVEHLPDLVGENVLHRGPERAYVPHLVHVDPSSRLARILETTSPSPASSHHQAIRRPGTGLSIVARAPDGTIEGVELRGHPWLVAVQWHPEHTAAEDAAQQRLFDQLVAAAAELRRT
ncbi:MAG: gamma-glutamyl-gamma-aminobutyrate hydrolase family protein [Planctomycetes bacterium]|nr:gamma-glutamyl-gamma-aminobutyrate hydrolase family protein [Planctomycetota bacterium]